MPADLTVWKFVLDTQRGDLLAVQMPRGARMLDAGAQGGVLCVWALVDPKAELEIRAIRIAGTGHSLGDDVDPATTYVGRAEFLDGQLQLHVFDLGGEARDTD